MTRWLGLVVLAVLSASSAVFVGSGDVAVVYRFGVIDRTLTAGLGLRAPWPIEQHEIVDVSEVRRVETGKVRMLTGDTNLIDVDLIIQYTVSDPVAYQVGLAEPEETITSVVFGVTKDIIATMGVDVLLTTGRAQLQQEAERAAQALLDRHRTGLRLAAVEVRELTPPPAVLDAFKDVSSARGDRDTLALAAEAYVSKRLPEVRGVSAEQIESSKAYAAERHARASGDVVRFSQLRNAHRVAPQSTKAQLWTETVNRIGQQATIHALRDATEITIPVTP